MTFVIQVARLSCLLPARPMRPSSPPPTPWACPSPSPSQPSPSPAGVYRGSISAFHPSPVSPPLQNRRSGGPEETPKSAGIGNYSILTASFTSTIGLIRLQITNSKGISNNAEFRFLILSREKLSVLKYGKFGE